MPLVPVREILQRARAENYAVGYFESWNFESLQGVIDAVESVRAPVIIGFNGEFMSAPGRRAAERLEWYAALGRAAAATARVPCGFIFNECADDDWLRRAATAGFNLIMPADAAVPHEVYEQRVAALVPIAHAAGAAVEAEIGLLPNGADATHPGEATDPELAARFVAATGIDLLAVSVGNVHIKLEGREPLDLSHLERIRRRVDIPLVLHGGTGISTESLVAAIKFGIVKVNYGTCLKQAYLRAVRRALAAPETNPHELLGIGGDADLMVAGRLAVRDAVLERIEPLGCCGRA